MNLDTNNVSFLSKEEVPKKIFEGIGVEFRFDVYLPPPPPCFFASSLKSTLARRVDWINDAIDEARGKNEGRSRWRERTLAIPDIIPRNRLTKL